MKKTQPSLLVTSTPVLHAATQRAENIANVLRRALAALLAIPRAQRDGPAEAEVWLTGRAEEVLLVVDDLREDVQSGRLSDAAGAATLDRYLDNVLLGVQQFAPRAGARVASRYDTAPASPEEMSPFTRG